MSIRHRDWTVYDVIAPRRFSDQLYVTLNPRGDFVINLRTFEHLNEPEAVELLFDRNRDEIGIKPSTVDRPNAILVHTRHSRYNKVFRSLPFLRLHGILLESTVQFPKAFIDEEGILVLGLRDRVAAGHMPRKNGKARWT